MNLQGALIGLVAFLIIGIFHPIVIKSEYHFSHKVWPLFLVIGIVSITVVNGCVICGSVIRYEIMVRIGMISRFVVTASAVYYR